MSIEAISEGLDRIGMLPAGFAVDKKSAAPVG
jgi:hypothetical protein